MGRTNGKSEKAEAQYEAYVAHEGQYPASHDLYSVMNVRECAFAITLQCTSCLGKDDAVAGG